jgi:hypothetical protein
LQRKKNKLVLNLPGTGHTPVNGLVNEEVFAVLGGLMMYLSRLTTSPFHQVASYIFLLRKTSEPIGKNHFRHDYMYRYRTVPPTE